MALTQKQYIKYMACITMDPDSRERYFRRQKELAKKEQITPETQKLLNAIRSDSVPEITAIFTQKKVQNRKKQMRELHKK